MLKAAVFSDTHGSTAPMLEAARGANADVLIHLGDYGRARRRSSWSRSARCGRCSSTATATA